jgi:hypothetical protein
MNRRALAALVLCGLAAGCATPTTGQPAAVAGSPALPPRPRALPLDHVDLCTLLTAQDRAALGVGAGRPGRSSEEDPADALPVCNWDHVAGASADTYSLASNTLQGADYPLGKTETQVFDIAGYAGVQYANPDRRAETGCEILADVAAGQSLQIRYTYFGPPGASTHDSACRKARAFLARAVTTLSRLEGS